MSGTLELDDYPYPQGFQAVKSLFKKTHICKRVVFSFLFVIKIPILSCENIQCMLYWLE